MMTSARWESRPRAARRRRAGGALGLEVRQLLDAHAELLGERRSAPRCESQETPYSLDARCAQLAEHLLVQLQLVGAHRAEGERVEDEHGRVAEQVLLGEGLLAVARAR